MTTQERSLRSSERVEPAEFSRRVSAKLGDRAADVEVRFGHVWAKVQPGDVREVVRALKEDPEIACDYLTFLSGVDWQEDGMEVVILLLSVRTGNTVGLNVPLAKDRPVMPSIKEVFRGADWHERETHEMFGIEFEGHGEMVKLYLPEDFEGHPLRKDFRLASRAFKPWPGAKDPSEAAGGGRA